MNEQQSSRVAPAEGRLARLSEWYSRRSYGGGKAPEPVRVFAHHPALLIGYGAFETALERSHRVDARLKGLAELKVATMVGCQWCMDFGSWLVQAQGGLGERELRALSSYEESDVFTPLEKLVIDYAVAMTQTPAEVDDELFARLREHFDEGQLVELTTAIAIENFRARFNDAFGMAAQGYSEGRFCVVPEPAGAAR